MRNIRLIVEYDGSAYAGWQFQTHAPTVQGTLAEAVRRLTGEASVVTGASRTDAGVHSLGQTANFKTASLMPVYNIQLGLNYFLPEDVAIKEASECPLEFDSRHDSKGKTYVYRIVNRGSRSALMRGTAWHVFRPLDAALMREAAGHMIGEKDFASFMAADSQAAHSRREVTAIEIREHGEGLMEIEVRGTAFLRHMVRIMAGTLVEAGAGRLRPAAVAAIIEARDRRRAPMTAPARGLTLVKVEY
ncbi:MAG: tRNA pseudouridine(38-40) synthase TruA [Deltaproteobacteria bacterium]|nr:tRNA pseudouridine(38-40) synthase TruA [Deltaproteobacteria bacterium]